MPRRQLHPAARGVVAVLLVAWLAVLAIALLAPSPAGPTWLVDTVARVGAEEGLPSSLTALSRVEFVLNVVAFAPVPFLGALLWARLTWRDWTAGGFVASFAVEVIQAVALNERSATHADIVANTLGALVGAFAGTIVVRLFGGDERYRTL
ncbi:VanZ family protein [Nocardioides cavernae]|uniref:VanZ family protein n=1 Tax=Nocardioides TaxID=1839 RepID=UPI0009E810F5|nr:MULTISPECIES: VanZ family protein [Nocardioides]MCK9822197.1 VanZ family protein [Nocardioides cavernae]